MQPSNVLLIFPIPRPSKLCPKSKQKRLQNQLCVGYPPGPPEFTILDVKTSPRWAPKISNFCQKSVKNSSCYGLWSKMPLEASKNPPRAFQEASQSLPTSVPEPSKSNQELSRSRICGKFRNARLVPGRHAAWRRIVVDQVHAPAYTVLLRRSHGCWHVFIALILSGRCWVVRAWGREWSR